MMRWGLLLEVASGHYFGAVGKEIAVARNLPVRPRAVIVEAAWFLRADSTQGHSEGKRNLISQRLFLCCSEGNSVTLQLGNELCLAAMKLCTAVCGLLRSPSTPFRLEPI